VNTVARIIELLRRKSGPVVDHVQFAPVLHEAQFDPDGVRAVHDRVLQQVPKNIVQDERDVPCEGRATDARELGDRHSPGDPARVEVEQLRDGHMRLREEQRGPLVVHGFG
jgi:hypothetical protein